MHTSRLKDININWSQDKRYIYAEKYICKKWENKLETVGILRNNISKSKK